MASRIMKVKIEEQVTRTTEIPVWTGFCDDQRVRWNKKNRVFEFQFFDGEDWEPMDWSMFLEGKKIEVRDTLTKLIELLDATR